MTKGFFIALEGIDGSGKSTLRESLAQWLKETTDHEVFIGWEPKKAHQGIWAAQIRGALEGKFDAPMDPFEFQRLYVLDRAEDIYFSITPELAKGNFVLYDRYALSTLAYGMLADISIDRLLKLHDEVIGPAMIMPKINIVLDIDPAVALSRKSAQYDKPEHFEKIESLQKIRAAYHILANDPRFKSSTFVVNANQPLADVQLEIQGILEKML
jgi:dTMP kinase